MSDNRDKELEKIKNEVLNLKESPLYEYRKQNKYFPVIGEGSHHANIIFIGEAPGENEAKQGRPFCGAAGRILDELLHSVNIDRNDVSVSFVHTYALHEKETIVFVEGLFDEPETSPKVRNKLAKAIGATTERLDCWTDRVKVIVRNLIIAAGMVLD